MTDDAAEFLQAVETEFRFLEDRFGFQRKGRAAASNLVRYETRALYVVLALGRRNEVQMLFGRRGVDDLPGAYSFETGDLLQLKGCEDWQWKSDCPGLTGFVSQLAELLQARGAEGLSGDLSTFERMKVRRDGEIEDWHRHERERPLRLKASAAWQAKDYRTVVEALGGIRNSLSEGEARRLGYALKQI